MSISTESLHRAGLGSVVSRSERRFDVDKLPADMLRVYRALEEKYGQEYALLFVFTMRTAIEMHRAWHSEYMWIMCSRSFMFMTIRSFLTFPHLPTKLFLVIQ